MPARPNWLIRQLDYELAEVMKRASEIRVEPFRASEPTGEGRKVA